MTLHYVHPTAGLWVNDSPGIWIHDKKAQAVFVGWAKWWVRTHELAWISA